MTQFANDGSNGGVFEPGIYYLAITEFNNDPFGDGGEIFFQESRDEISGPDGNGGSSPHAGWTGQGIDAGGGSYRVDLKGVEYAVVPAPGAISLLAVAGLCARRRRR